MNLLIIFGAQAVGKMTVGEELTKITDMKMFHNHMSIEIGLKLAEYGTPVFNDINGGIRDVVMKSFVKHKKNLIFTYVWALDQKNDWDYIDYVKSLFDGYNVYFVELVSHIDERLRRNTTEKRLAEKSSKRNVEFSKNELLNSMKKYRLFSNEGEFEGDNYFKIDNTKLSADRTAILIKTKFNL